MGELFGLLSLHFLRAEKVTEKQVRVTQEVRANKGSGEEGGVMFEVEFKNESLKAIPNAFYMVI